MGTSNDSNATNEGILIHKPPTLTIVWAASQLRLSHSEELVGSLIALPDKAASQPQKIWIFGAHRASATESSHSLMLIRLVPGDSRREFHLEDISTSRRQLLLRTGSGPEELQVANGSLSRNVFINGLSISRAELEQPPKWQTLRLGDRVEIEGRLLLELTRCPSTLLSWSRLPPLTRQACPQFSGRLGWRNPEERWVQERLVRGLSYRWLSLEKAIDELRIEPFVFLHGPGGVGKTALALELCARQHPKCLPRWREASALTPDLFQEECRMAGTLILVHVEELTLEVQRLLRGELENPAAIVKFIFTSKYPLERLRTGDELRGPLLRLLGQSALRVPPLDERPEDILLLAEYFLFLCLPSGACAQPYLLQEWWARRGSLFYGENSIRRPALDTLSPMAQKYLTSQLMNDGLIQLGQVLRELVKAGFHPENPAPLSAIAGLLELSPGSNAGRTHKLSPVTPQEVVDPHTPEWATWCAWVEHDFEQDKLKQHLHLKSRQQVWRRLNCLFDVIAAHFSYELGTAVAWCSHYRKSRGDGMNLREKLEAAIERARHKFVPVERH